MGFGDWSFAICDWLFFLLSLSSAVGVCFSFLVLARRGVSPFAPFFRDLCVPCCRGSLGEVDWLTPVSVAGAYAAGLAAWNCPVLVASFVLINGMRAWA